MMTLSGKLKELGYFFKGYRQDASDSLIKNAMFVMMGLILSPKKTLKGISDAVSGQASEDRLRKFLNHKGNRRHLRRIMDEKARCRFLHAIKQNDNFLYQVYLIFDATYVGRYSLDMEDLFFVGKGSSKIGNHIFLVGMFVLHDGTRIPLRPRLQQNKKSAGKKYRTQNEIVADMVRAVGFAKDLIVVADSFYLSKTFTDAILEMGHDYVIAAKSNRVVVENGSEMQLRDYVTEEDIRSRLRPITLEGIRSRGRDRCKRYSACKRALTIKNLGEVAVVFSRKYRKRRAEMKMFVSSLIDAPLQDLMEYYDIRWEIEVFFREIKSLLGFEACRMKSSVAHENWAILVCLGFLHLQELSQKHQATRWKRSGPRGQPRTADYLELYSHLVQKKNIEHIFRAATTNHDRKRITQYFALSAQLATK